MFHIETRPPTTDKAAFYETLAGDLQALVRDECDLIANAAT